MSFEKSSILITLGYEMYNDTSPIHTAFSRQDSCADIQRWDDICVDKLAALDRCVMVWWHSVWKLNRSFTYQIKDFNPESNVTRPNNSNVIAGLWHHKYCSVLITLCHTSCWLVGTMCCDLEQKKCNSYLFCLRLLCCCNYFHWQVLYLLIHWFTDVM